MSFNSHGSMSRRNNPFARASPSSPGSTNLGRPKSSILSSSPATALPTSPSHTRSQSSTSPPASKATTPLPVPAAGTLRHTRHASKNGSLSSGTFAPSFIKSEELARRGQDPVKGIEGENDFSGKRYVWLKDPEKAFVKGWVVEDLDQNRIRVQCDDGTVSC